MYSRAIITIYKALPEKVMVVTGDTISNLNRKMPIAVKEVVEKVFKEDCGMSVNVAEIEKVVSQVIRDGSYIFAGTGLDIEVSILPAENFIAEEDKIDLEKANSFIDEKMKELSGVHKEDTESANQIISSLADGLENLLFPDQKKSTE